jgi:hypothetical protein
MVFQEQVRHPGDNGEGAQGGKDHGNRNIGGHGSHIGPHHAGDEKEGGERDDDSDGGHDHRRQNLSYGEQGGQPRRFVPTTDDVALDVVHVGDGVVHNETQRENEGEKGDAVDGIAQQHVDEKGQGKADRHRQGHNHRLPPPQGKGQQHHYRGDGEQQGAQQTVDLLLGGFAIVAGDVNADTMGQDLFFRALSCGTGCGGKRSPRWYPSSWPGRGSQPAC